MASKKEEPRASLRSRVAEKFSHEDEPETEPESEPEIHPLKPVYSVGAGATPELKKRLQATIEADRKELKKKQKPD